MTRGAPEAARPAWTLLLAALVLLAGAAVYVDGLAAMRGMLQHDEAYYAVNALSLLEQPRLQFFFPQNTGREALWMYLLAGGLALFGVQPWTLRVVAALVAIVTLAALLRLGRVLFGWRGGLLAALALAGLYLVVHNSHVAFRVLLYPLFGCLALAFLLQAQRHNRAALWRAGGVCAGLLAHTYTAAHGWLALLAALCLLWAWRDAGRRRGALVALLLAVGIAAPVYLAMLTTPAPDGGLGRTLVTDVAELQRNVQNWLQAWRGYGDINPNHNIPNWPILDEVQAGLALAGLVAGWLVLRRRWEGLLLLALFLLALLPGLITLRTPQYIRAYGIIVPLALVIGAGARLLAGSPHARGARLRGALAAGLLLVSLGHSATVWHAWLREYRLVLYIDDRINTGMALIQAQTAPGTPIYFPYSGAAPATTIPFHPVADFHARAMQRPLVFFAFPDQPGACFMTPRGPVVYLDLPNLVNQMARRAAAYGEVQRLGATPPDEVNVLLFTPAAALVDDWPGAARSDDALLLQTVSAPALTAAPGDTIAMDLGLRVLRPPARPLTFFVHLQGDPTPYEGGPLYAGGDAPLCAAALEPGRRPEETLVQRLTLTLPADLPPGAYHVAVGLYDPASGQRPPLVTATGDRRFYRAADITVR